MFAQLGDIKFELITYFSGIEESASYHFATHERINKKPILQYLGENLKEITLKLNFHSSICVPENELKNLKAVAEDGAPQKFIKGNGEYLGIFVISEIRSVTEQTSNEGDLIYIQVELQLTEYAGKLANKKSSQGGLKMK